jgi:hypothetical protein
VYTQDREVVYFERDLDRRLLIFLRTEKRDSSYTGKTEYVLKPARSKIVF